MPRINPKQFESNATTSPIQSLYLDSNLQWRNGIFSLPWNYQEAASFSSSSASWVALTSDIAIPSSWLNDTILVTLTGNYTGIKSPGTACAGAVGWSIDGSVPTVYSDWEATDYANSFFLSSVVIPGSGSYIKAWAKSNTNSTTMYLENIILFALVIQGRGTNP
jgi:hypothetical protein